MKAVKYLAIGLVGFFLLAGCQKELSFENGQPLTAATGTLKDTLGNCMPITVNGKYVRGAALSDSNTVVIRVNFSSPGSYNISTDSADGFSFSSSGIMTDSGLQSITLKGTGTPVSAQLTNFAIAFDSSVCMFSVTVFDSSIVAPVTSGDYFPTTDSSNWTYGLNTDPTGGDTLHTAVALTNQTISGAIYRTFISTAPGIADSSFYRKGGGLYYQYGDLNDVQVYDTVNNKVEYIFLKDTEPVSSTWESPEVDATLGSIAGKAKIKFTIEGKDITTTLGANSIDSVLQVKREYMFAPAAAGGYATIVTAQFYYAKNIGFIKAETSGSSPFTINADRWEIYY